MIFNYYFVIVKCAIFIPVFSYYSFFPSSPLFIIVKLYACVYKYNFSRNGYINFLF